MSEEENIEENLSEKLQKATAFHAEIDKLYADIFADGGKKEALDNFYDSLEKISLNVFDDDGIEKKLISLHKSSEENLDYLEKHKDQIEIDFQDLYNSKEKEINDLLPSAGAAGLAEGYHKSKEYFGCVYKSILNHMLFISPLAVTFLFATYNFSEDKFINLETLQDLKIDTIFIKILIFSPLLFVSYFGFSSIRLNRRMYEEYNHKQRVMQLYRSFDEEIQGEAFDDERKELITNMLKTVSHEPSGIMGKYDKTTLLEVLKELIKSKNKASE